MNYKIFIVAIILILATLHTNANTPPHKNGYRIEVSAPSKKGNMAYLANYWNGETYITDSTMVSSNGAFVFSSENTTLPTGQYLLYIKPNTQIELLIDKEQENIRIELDDNDLSRSKISGSNDTKLFWEYITGLSNIQTKLDEYDSKIKTASENNTKDNEAEKQYIKTIKELNTYTDQYIKKHKNSWFATFIKSTQAIEEPNLIPTTREQIIENNIYKRKHYFDHIDFEDDKLWRTSFFAPQIDSYLHEWIPQHPDTIAKESSWLVSKTLGNDQAFEKMLSYLTNNATTSKAMGMENVWAKLAEDYIFDKNISWIDSTQQSNLRMEYSLVEKNRIGMRGENLSLRTIDGDSINTDDIEANYLLLYFFSPTCSHCETEMPLLKNEFYPKYENKGFKIVTINIDRNVESWKKFVDKHNIGDWTNTFDPEYKSEFWLKYNTEGTPSLYLLDKNKTIIAKKLDIANLEKYLERIIR